MKTISITILTHYLPFPLSFFHECAVELSRGYTACNDATAGTDNGICACVFLCFNFKFSNCQQMLIHRNKHLLVLNHFSDCKSGDQSSDAPW